MTGIFKKKFKQLQQAVSLKSLAKITTGLIVFYLLFSYLAVDPIAKKLIPRIAEQSLASKASVSRVTFDPFRLKATINGFELMTQNGQPLANFKKLVIDFELSGMFKLAWQFKQIAVLEPQIELATASNGEFNWDGLIAKLDEDQSPPSNTIPRIVIEQIVVGQGQIRYADANRKTPFKTTLTPLNFELEGFSTLPQDRGDYLVSAAFANQGGSLKWKGDLSVNPVASNGTVALSGVKISRLLQLAKGLTLPITIKDGVIQTSFNYDFSLPEATPTLAINHFNFSVRDVASTLAQGGDLAIAYAALSAPSIHFVSNEQSVLRANGVDFKLGGVHFDQPNALKVTLQESQVRLPKLDFSMLKMATQETPQLVFGKSSLQFSGLSIKQHDQFLLAVPQVEVTNVNFDLKQSQLKAEEITLTDIRFDGSQVATKPLATLGKGTIADVAVALSERKISAQSVLFSQFETAVIKQMDNQLNWVEALEVKRVAGSAKAEVVTKESAETARPAWQVNLGKIGLEKAHIHLQDNSAPKAMVMDVEDVSLAVENASLDMKKALPIEVAFKVKQGGQFSSRGQVWPSPFKADLGLRLSNLSLKPLAPYLNRAAFLKLNAGAADISGRLRVEQKQEIGLDFNGKFDVKHVAIVEEAGAKPFLSWAHLQSDKLKVSLMPNQLSMSTLHIVEPSGKFIINPDKSINIQQILRSSVENRSPPINNDISSDSPIKPALTVAVTESVTVKDKSTTVEAASSDEAFPIDIGAIRVSDAKLEFADLSLTPQFGTNIHSLNGVVNGLSTKAARVAQIELDGKVDDYGSASIIGSLQPFNATEFTDVKVTFVNLDMNRLTPYSGKFAGRRIEAGKLSVDLGYKIKQQQLLGTNKFVINKIKLGEKVESADAADLPLDLAIAILEDSNGVIDLDLPISGRLDNPTFSYSGIFWKAFRNVLTKIVTAPFSVLGKLFGGDDENFDGILFDAGVSEISPPELEKLANMSKALDKRQSLILGIVPSYHLALDTQAIKQNTYRQQVLKEMGVELKPGQKPGPIDLANEDVQSAVDDLYNELTKKGLLTSLVSKLQKPEAGHYEKAQTSLIESVEVTDVDLKALAAARAEAIKTVLLTNGVNQERVSIADMAGAKEGERVKMDMKLDVKK